MSTSLEEKEIKLPIYKQERFRILAIDPGACVNTGYTVLEINKDKITLLESGLIYATQDIDADKLVYIKTKLSTIIFNYQPDVVVYEAPYMLKGENAPRINYVVGIILLVARDRDKKLYIFNYNPTSIKKTITGNAKAGKKDIQQAIGKYIDVETLSRIKVHHVWDAIAIGLTYLVKNNRVKAI